MYRVEQYLNAGQREAFRRKVEKVEKKRKTDSAKSAFHRLLDGLLGVNHSAK